MLGGGRSSPVSNGTLAFIIKFLKPSQSFFRQRFSNSRTSFWLAFWKKSTSASKFTPSSDFEDAHRSLTMCLGFITNPEALLDSKGTKHNSSLISVFVSFFVNENCLLLPNICCFLFIHPQPLN